jgi:hypothetical protein
MPAGDGVIELHVGDRLKLSKRHPCGSHAWRVTRTGADIGLQCEGCGRRVMLERREVERRLAADVEHGEGEADQ